MDHSHSPHGAAVSSAAELHDDGTSHARGRRGRRDNPPSHLHGAPSATNQPTLSRGCGDHPHSHPPHHEGMRDQSLSFSSERDGDINGLKTHTSAPFPTRSAGSSTKRSTASSTIRHPRLVDLYAAAPSPFNDLIRQYDNAPTSFNTLLRQRERDDHASSQPLHTSTDIDNNHQPALSQPPHSTNPTISYPTTSYQHASSQSLQTMEHTSSQSLRMSTISDDLQLLRQRERDT